MRMRAPDEVEMKWPPARGQQCSADSAWTRLQPDFIDGGADDYLGKPFAFAELLARLRALARRPADALETTFEAGDVRLDPATRRVWRGEREINLSNKEFRILECLIRRPNHVLTRRM